jgi:hypothetical protein
MRFLFVLKFIHWNFFFIIPGLKAGAIDGIDFFYYPWPEGQGD